MKAYLIIACALISNQALADTILKCETAQGKVYYSNTECYTGDKASFKTVNPTVTDSSGLREWAQRNPARRQVTAPQSPTIKPSKKESIECGNAERMYRHEKGYRYAKNLSYLYNQVCRNCGQCPE